MSVVTVVATYEAFNAPPRVRLDVTDTGDSPALNAANVFRVSASGTRSPVRTGDGNPLVLSGSGPRTALLYDYEMSYGLSVTYTTAESSGMFSNSISVTEDVPWLVHPGDPSLSVPLVVIETGVRSSAVRRGVHQPMGRAAPVVRTSGVRSAPEYVLQVRTETTIARMSMDRILADAGLLLLNVPASLGWGIGAEYVAVGDVRESRLYNWGGEQRRNWELPCLVVDAPIGGFQSQRTYVDLLNFPTYADLNAAYPTYTALLAGP